MKAAVFKAVGQPLVIERRPDPAPARDEVVVQVAGCGICGSDLHMTRDSGFIAPPDTVLGHEYAGEIVALGADVAGCAIGDRVAVSPLFGCGTCTACRAGMHAWCPRFEIRDGGYAEYAQVSARQCIPIRETLSLDDAALAEPLAVALHGVTRSGMRRGARVLVLGAGPIGLATAYWARRRGAGALTVVDLNGYQRDRALAVGASAFIARDGNELPLNEVRSALDGAPEIVFECVGRPGMIAEAISYAGVQATVVVLGICAEPDTFVPRAALMKEIRLQTSAFFEMSEYLMALDALDEARVLPRALVSDTVSLAALPATFEAMRQRTRECKVLVRPHH